MKYGLIIIIWLAVWEIVSLFVNNNILLVGPWDVCLALVNRLAYLDFYKSIVFTFGKIGLGFVTGAVVGGILAVISWKNHFLEDLLTPLISFMKAAPVAAFVVLFLIWWNSRVLSVAICICIVLPQIYVSILQGLQNADKELLEVAKVFDFSVIDRINYIYRPKICEYLEGAVKVSVGMAWKASVAAEVIGTPEYSIGNKLYMSKIYLDTAGVLAWTLVIILLSLVCERLMLMLVGKYAKYEFSCRGSATHNNRLIQSENETGLVINGLCKSYGENHILKDFSEEYTIGKEYRYEWPSGAGKTTLFKIVAGLVEADSGSIEPKDYSVSMVFQDNRLIEAFSAVTNVSLICGSRKKAEDILLSLLGKEEIIRPVATLSGGQKRRVSIARAIAKNADIAMFDEPYEGLDEELKNKVQNMIMEYGQDKVLMISSHFGKK